MSAPIKLTAAQATVLHKLRSKGLAPGIWWRTPALGLCPGEASICGTLASKGLLLRRTVGKQDMEFCLSADAAVALEAWQETGAAAASHARARHRSDKEFAAKRARAVANRLAMVQMDRGGDACWSCGANMGGALCCPSCTSAR